MKIIIAIIMFLGFSFLYSCTEDCMDCKIVTYDKDENIIDETEPQEYCGEALDEKLNAEPVVIGDNTSKWVCE